MKRYGWLVYWMCASWCAVAQPLQPYPDNSLELAAYVEIGIPPADRLWAAADYKEAFRFLERIHQIDKWSLPRRDSPASGVLFARMTALENLDYLTQPHTDLRLRLEAVNVLGEYLYAFHALYNEPNEVYQRFGGEALATHTCLLYFALQVMALLDEVSAYLPQGSADAKNLRESKKSLQYQYAALVGEALETLETIPARYPAAYAADYSRTVAKLAAKHWAVLPADAAQLLTPRIQRLPTQRQLPISLRQPWTKIVEN